VFHAISAFNNAGFSLFSDSLAGFAVDPWIGVPIVVAVLCGGLGVPVLVELWRRRGRPSRWSLHTRITVLMSAVLVPVGTIFVLAAEWSNPATLGGFSTPGRLLASLVQGVAPRSAGFSVLDPAAMRQGTWFGAEVLMFIGGGSASVAGGIKVTTFAVLLAIVWSTVRGESDVRFFDRRISPIAQRQAVTVTLLGVAVIVVSVVVIDLTSHVPLDQVLGEVVSASTTAGLSAGVASRLGAGHRVLLTVLMYAGRLGPAILGTSLAVRERPRAFRRPESAPIIG
jgi:trk system potassium uptake protein